MKHTAWKIQGLQGTHSYRWPTVSAFIFSKHFGFLRKNFITLLIILYLKLVPVRQIMVSHLPSLQRRERKNEKLKITEHQLKFSWFPGVWFVPRVLCHPDPRQGTGRCWSQRLLLSVQPQPALRNTSKRFSSSLPWCTVQAGIRCLQPREKLFPDLLQAQELGILRT